MSQVARKPLSDRKLRALLGARKLADFSIAKFGTVMITEAVATGRRRVNVMFRQPPNPRIPFNGWVFLSGDESASELKSESGLALHDALTILRVAPEVRPYLHLPPGSHLVRCNKKEFEETEP